MLACQKCGIEGMKCLNMSYPPSWLF